MCKFRCSDKLPQKDAAARGVKGLVKRLQVLEDVIEVKQALFQNLRKKGIYDGVESKILD